MTKRRPLLLNKGLQSEMCGRGSRCKVEWSERQDKIVSEDMLRDKRGVEA